MNDLSFEGESGLSYVVCRSATPSPTKCLVLLHGVGGNESNLIDLASGVDADTLVVLPRGPLQLGLAQFAWFRVTFSAAGPTIVAEEAERSRQVLVKFVKKVQNLHRISAKNTVIGGFSQGGIMSASVGLSEPESVAGFAILSGRILPELQPHHAARERLAGLRAFVGHGEFDSKLPLEWAQRADRLLTELGVGHELQIYPIDHGISDEMRRDFLAWFGQVV